MVFVHLEQSFIQPSSEVTRIDLSEVKVLEMKELILSTIVETQTKTAWYLSQVELILKHMLYIFKHTQMIDKYRQMKDKQMHTHIYNDVDKQNKLQCYTCMKITRKTLVLQANQKQHFKNLCPFYCNFHFQTVSTCHHAGAQGVI